MSIPPSHRADTSTSREAAQRKAESGTVDTDRAELVALVHLYPGRNVKELAKVVAGYAHGLEHERQRLGRRVSEAIRLGLIHAQGKEEGCQRLWPGPAPEDAKQQEMFEAPAGQWKTD